jgi:hypothetical protein
MVANRFIKLRWQAAVNIVLRIKFRLQLEAQTN